MFRMFVSESYALEDCIDYDALTSNHNKFSLTGSANITYNSNGLSFVGTANSNCRYMYNGTLPTNFIVEYDVVSFTIGRYDSSGEIITSHTTLCNARSSGNTIMRAFTFTDEYNSQYTYTDLTLVSTPYHLKIVVNNETATFYIDNVQVHQRSSGNSDIGFKAYNERGVVVKNMKIKPL